MENLDSSISPRFTSIVESCKRSSILSSSTGLDLAVDCVSKSPKGVTEDGDVDPGRRVELIDVGLGVRDSISRVMPGLSSSPSGLVSSRPKSINERKCV